MPGRELNNLSKWVLLIPACLFVAALNPYMATSTYDNTDYYEGIQHFVKTGQYLIREGYPTGWAPVVPWILSIPGQLGFTSIWWIKGGITAFAILSLVLLCRLFYIEKRDHGVLAILLFASSPIALLLSSRLLTEWPYVFFSTAFLIALHHLEKTRSSFYAALTGITLLGAVFTRYIGIALVVPLVFQGLFKCKSDKKEGKIEFVIFLFCSALFAAWQYFIKYIIPTINEHVSFNFAQSVENFSHIDLFGIFYVIVDQIFYIHLVENQLVRAICYSITFAALALGMRSLIRQKKIHYSDLYVFAYIPILLLYKYSITRYIFPVAPFLYIYFIEGIKELWRLSKIESFLQYKRAVNLFFIPLLACYYFVSLHLIFLGNGKTYNGLNYFISPREEQFYKGEALALYQASKFIGTDPAKFRIYTKIKSFADYQYVRIFAGREIAFSIDPTVKYILTQRKIQSEIPKETLKWFELAGEFDDYLVYRVKPEQR